MTNGTGFQPTEEQSHALNLFRTCLADGRDMAIEAGAGAGKTSTLMLLAQAAGAEGLSGAYFAFNRSIVDETASRAEKLRLKLRVSTIHSAAMAGYGHLFAHRINSSARVKSSVMAERLGIRSLTLSVNGAPKTLSAGYLASVCMRGVTLFCQSADPAPTGRHLPYIEGIDMPASDGRRTWANNNRVQAHLERALDKAWADIQDPRGNLPYRHEHYLKGWELSNPVIDADYVLFDEAQDVSPVMFSIISQQRCPKVYVGDSAQAIYGFTGAVDALGKIISDGALRATLSQSFRFGPEIADVANRALSMLPGNDMTLTGSGLPGTVGPLAEHDVVLCRTNASAVTHYLRCLDDEVSAHIVGGGTEVKRFAQAAQDLATKRFTSHPELGCFKSWDEVLAYVSEDAQGSELKLLVSLVQRFGAPTLIQALDRMPSEAKAEVIISTAHKAKGREWARVMLADDFPSPKTDPDTGETKPLDPSEIRLLYVAVTRAQRELDITRVRHLA